MPLSFTRLIPHFKLLFKDFIPHFITPTPHVIPFPAPFSFHFFTSFIVCPLLLKSRFATGSSYEDCSENISLNHIVIIREIVHKCCYQTSYSHFIALVNIETALLHRGYILTFMSYVSPLFVLFSFRIFSLASVYPGGPFQLIYQTFHPYFCHKCYNTIPGNKYVAEVWQGSVFFLHFFKSSMFYLGSHRVRKVQFFLTLFKRPLTPPLSFEHHVVNFLYNIQWPHL